MGSVWLYADPHFGHQGVCRFTRSDGSKLRPWDDKDAMDDAMIEMFNETVSVNDKCYFLGDVVINRKALKTLERINCKNLVLIKGNHDIFRLEEYTKYFRDIRSYHVMNGCILSHIPIHKDSLGRFGCNIHGHLHANRVMMGDVVDPNYYCVSVEHTEFCPILFEEVLKRIKEQGGTVGFKNGNGPLVE